MNLQKYKKLFSNHKKILRDERIWKNVMRWDRKHWPWRLVKSTQVKDATTEIFILFLPCCLNITKKLGQSALIFWHWKCLNKKFCNFYIPFIFIGSFELYWYSPKCDITSGFYLFSIKVSIIIACIRRNLSLDFSSILYCSAYGPINELIF